MAKDKKEKEEKKEVKDIPQKPTKNTFVKRWFDEYVVNDKSDMKTICDLTSTSAEQQFSMYLKTGNTETYAVTFYATFMTIMDYIKSKQKSYNNFSIAICNSINIGYTNNDDPENEKVGNFMPFMEYIGVNRHIVDNPDNIEDTKTSQNLIRWKELNVKQNVEFVKEISSLAYENLKKNYGVTLRTEEAVIPLFCIFMDNVTNYIKYKYKELKGRDVSEVSMNVLGLFDVYYSYDEDEDKEYLEFVPQIALKLKLKNDSVASRE